MPSIVRLVVLGAAAATLASCGGDDKSKSSSSSSSSGVSESAWAKQVNTVCAENKQAVAGVVQKVQSEGLTGDKAAAAVLDRSVEIEERLLGKLGDIEAPAALQDDYDRFVTRLHDAIGLLSDLADDLRAGKRTDPELTTRATKIAADTRPFATEHGLQTCLPDAS